ncbi:MAG: hypothetical protein NC831_04270 [Candidatus Omnitrophica bacterium]|nr:hypothetical protein [Candidatus Omnitrophota bacterium]MCM8828573.1 hypothetical protein [Candidatus Omnitrophota bacterium]
MKKIEGLVSIAVDIPVRTVFTYKTETGLLPGQRVRVPFGNRKVTGWVVGPGVPGDYRYKNILNVYDESPIIPEYLLLLAQKISENYFSSTGSVLAAMSKGLTVKKMLYRIEQPEKSAYFSFSEKPLPQNVLEMMNVYAKNTSIVKFSTPEKKKNFLSQAPVACSGSCLMVFSNQLDAKRYYEILRPFYGNRVIFLTGEMRKTEKTIRWKRILNEKNLIVIGTRFCLFSPVSDLSLVIVDEPSEYGHKENKDPRYNSREVALMISEILKIPVIFTVFQPDVTDVFMIKSKNAALVEIGEKNGNVKVVISQIQDQSQKQILTDISKHLLEKTIIEKNKVVIIHNIKGYARLVICKKCHSVFACQKCGGYVVPVSDRYVYCSICKKLADIPKKCPVCKGGTPGIRQPGIQKLIEVLKTIYPDFKAGTITETEGGDFSPEILIGTQGIVQHLEKISPGLVIFANADTIAARSVFRSEEKFFLLVGKIRTFLQPQNGTIVIQTRNPGLDVYGDVVRNDYEGFYKRELSIREKLMFPPYGDLIEIGFYGNNWKRNKDAVFEELKRCGEIYEISTDRKETFLWKVTSRETAFEILEKVVERHRITKISVDTNPFF